MTWAELVTKDVHRSTEFYEEVFDLGDMGLDGVNAGYQTLTKDDQSWAGVVDVSQRFPNGLSTIQGNPAPQWVPWFGVTDLHESVAIVTKLGGRVVLDPLELMPGLALCVVQGLEGELLPCTRKISTYRCHCRCYRTLASRYSSTTSTIAIGNWLHLEQ